MVVESQESKDQLNVRESFHQQDGEDYSQKISKVLRDGDVLTDWFRE